MLISDFVKSNATLFLHRLTAFVAKSFAQARAFIPEYIDAEMLEQSLAWMSRQTNRDGSFRKVGTVHSSYLKVDNVAPRTHSLEMALSSNNWILHSRTST